MTRPQPIDHWLVQTTSDTLNLACIYNYDCDPVDLAIYYANAENPFTDDSFADRIKVECVLSTVTARIGDVTVKVRPVSGYTKLPHYDDTAAMIAAISAQVSRYKPQPIEEYQR